MKDGTELTKRKAGEKLAAVEGGYASDEGGYSSDRGGVAIKSGFASDEGGAKGGDVRAVEFDIRPLCAGEPARRYLQLGEQLSPVVRGQPLARGGSLGGVAACMTLSGLTRELKEMFLPAGYPDSVSEDYLTFQLWDTTQAMCSYLRGVLATQSVLQSVGVGDDKATPLAAALQWVLRDGSGMIGGLVFAYAVGPKFDLNVKRWRLFADVINDVGLTLDMVAPYFPTLVTEVLCLSSICKTMCGVAAGATRSSLMTHFAKRDNMADCSAKEGSQETAVRLFGLLFGMYFASAVNSSPQTVWIAFVVLTVIHVIANYKAVSGLWVPTVNNLRGLILVQRFLVLSPSSGKDIATEQGQVGSTMIGHAFGFLAYEFNLYRAVHHSKCQPSGANRVGTYATDQKHNHGQPACRGCFKHFASGLASPTLLVRGLSYEIARSCNAYL